MISNAAFMTCKSNEIEDAKPRILPGGESFSPKIPRFQKKLKDSFEIPPLQRRKPMSTENTCQMDSIANRK